MCQPLADNAGKPFRTSLCILAFRKKFGQVATHLLTSTKVFKPWQYLGDLFVKTLHWQTTLADTTASLNLPPLFLPHIRNSCLKPLFCSFPVLLSRRTNDWVPCLLAHKLSLRRNQTCIQGSQTVSINIGYELMRSKVQNTQKWREDSKMIFQYLTFVRPICYPWLCSLLKTYLTQVNLLWASQNCHRK